MKVFISSTYKDLIDYRVAAIRAVEGTNYQASKMEVFGARPDEPLDACLKEVEQSDLFIGIYALRYGFIPEGADISITEMEYAHAKKLGKPIYCFILDDENQPWLQKWVEGEPGKTKLDEFKKRIQRDHVSAFFSTSADLGMKVANALSHYVANYRLLPAFELPSFEQQKSRGSTLPTLPIFFGREQELTVISNAISPESRTWGVLIDGPGGIGKTSLAIKAAHDAPGTTFERKIFITAKVRELTPEGEKSLTDFARPDYLALLNELALELGEEGIPRLAPVERADALRLALAGKKALIIFDNLETLPEDERTRLFQFLSRLPEGNKAIVTSRRRTDVDARVIRLDRLSSREAQLLIIELSKNNPRLAREDEISRTKLYETANGNPMLIRWICGQLGREGSAMYTIAEACDFLNNAPKGNNPFNYIFGDLLETLTESENKILATLAHFIRPAKSMWIAHITNLPERITETALEDLTDRSILISDDEALHFYLPALTAQFIKTNKQIVFTEMGQQLVDKVYALVKNYGGEKPDTKLLKERWPLIEASLPLFIEGENEKLQYLCKMLTFFFEYTGMWDEWIEINSKAEEKARQNNDLVSAGWQAYRISYAYSLKSEPSQVLVYLDKVENLWGLINNQSIVGEREKSIIIKLRGTAYRLQNNYKAAIQKYNEALRIRKKIDPEGVDVASVLADLSKTEYLNNDIESAENHCIECMIISDKARNKGEYDEHFDEHAAESGNTLAQIKLRKGEHIDAQKIARQSLGFARRVEREEIIAMSSISLAEALLKSSQPKEALSHIVEAVDICRRLRIFGNLNEATEILKECSSALENQEVENQEDKESNTSRSLAKFRVFLSYTRDDFEKALELYRFLTKDGIDVWLDKENLFPGDDWEFEIRKAVRESDLIIFCLSNKVITKKGYIQKEIKIALSEADLLPEGTIFIVPARFEDCAVPTGLGKWQWADLFDESGFNRLKLTVERRRKDKAQLDLE